MDAVPGNVQVDLALEEPVSRRPWFKLVLAFALGVTASTLGIYTFQAVSGPAPPPEPPPTATTTMTAVPASTPSPPPAVPPLEALSPPSPPPAAIDPAAAAPPLPAPAAPVVPAAPVPGAEQAELSAAEVLEVQTRLETLGMSPGFLDGIPGPRTVAAVRRYEEARGQTPTGTLDRELLKRLRQEPD